MPVVLKISARSGVPFYRQIEDQLADLIRRGELTAGTALPPLRDLATQLLVSLITVRRAYADLEHAGLVVSRQGQGTFVAESVETMSRVHARREAREILAQAFARARTLGLPEDEIEQISRSLRSQRAKVQGGKA